MQHKKQQLELDMAQWKGLKLGKEYSKAAYFHFANLTSMKSTSCEMTHKPESRLLGEIPTTSDMQMLSLNAESKEELMSLLMRVKVESEKAGLKHSKN